MRKILTFIILSLFMGNIFGQTINENIIKELRTSFERSSNNIAIQNAVSNNSINEIALNLEVANKEDHLFAVEVKSGSVTNQKSSGRCWMFTSFNVFRPVVMDKYNLSDFEFSETYLYFWDLLEKSNMFFERVIETASEDIYSREVHFLFDSPIGDGGAWNGFTNLVTKYGVVPKDVMPETYQSQNTRSFVNLINQKLREDGLILRQMVVDKKNKDQIQKQKVEMLKDVYRILALSLGEPPTEFSWRYKDKEGNISEYKNYTPMSFWNEAVNANLDEYVMFIDDPNRPYYKLYTKQDDKNVYEGIDWTYINLPVSELKQFAVASLKGGDIMYFSCDVGKQLSKQNGTLDLNNYNYDDLMGVNFEMTRAQRMLTHQSGSTHGMALCGVDFDSAGNPTKWKLENSWGSDYGNKGFLTMTDDWFSEYFFRMVINKKYLSDKIVKILSQKPTEVPYYNPAFSDDL